jgi:hypothetical protein
MLISAVSLCCFCLKLGKNWLPLLNDVLRTELLFEFAIVSSRLVELVLYRVFFGWAPEAPLCILPITFDSSLVANPASLVPLLVI